MEYFGLKLNGAGLDIEGFPDAVKVVQIETPLSRRISDLALHKVDLHFALECLDAITNADDEPSLTSRALWSSAIVSYFKCFGSSKSRFQLNARTIYKTESPIAMEVFNYFLNMRNKHYVHDENSHMQSVPGAIINDGSKTYKIEKIITLNAVSSIICEENLVALKQLVTTTNQWVENEFTKLCDRLAAELEMLPHEELMKMNNMVYEKPAADEEDKNRHHNPGQP